MTAAGVILTGQTHLTTTYWCILKGHCVSAGMMCAYIGFTTLPFCCFQVPLACLISFRVSYVDTLPFQQHTNNSTGTLHVYVKAESNTVAIAWSVAVLYYIV